jgi:hypothetical protein
MFRCGRSTRLATSVCARVRAQLDAAAFATAWAEGQAFSIEQAAAEALRIVARPQNHAATPA